jgi:molybdopterin synthase catalytic subunit
VAFIIPRVSYLTFDPIDPAQVLSSVSRESDGGIALFLGVVRNHNDGRSVLRLEYSAYEPMAEKELAAIARRLEERYPEARVAMRHRLGPLALGEIAVAVGASAPHRDEAFAACRAGIEAIKESVPIWKKEFGPDGTFWVDPCAHGESQGAEQGS